MRKLLLLIAIGLLFTQCKNNDDNPGGPVNIRLLNQSEYTFENITLESFECGSLEAGAYSDYKLFNSAYRYAFVEFEINAETYTYQPIDYVGETLLSSGNYTYVLDVGDLENPYSISLNLQID